MTEAGKKALVLGATGAVGKALLRDILKADTYASVTALGRREVTLDDTVPKEKLVQRTVDFENLESSRSDFKGYQDVFCCLGTTRAAAGSAEGFRKIDHDYVVNSAKIVAEENPGPSGGLSPVHYLYCSSLGANKNSMFLYTQSKGQTEQDIIDVGFKQVSIFRPSFLRVEEERPRTGLAESVLGKVLSFTKPLGLNMEVPVGVVGRAMIYAAAHPAANTESTGKTASHFYSGKELDEMGGANTTA
ncbi:hypothetical protein INT43_006070 [Umbelopsis isabellina]|uniref:NAD(P)-binding domain-containing protein n=1 Tax=Mortierella isabellina TaxID=91625 RepID=A0A8H7PJB3_MORIS|nr:hypothetical protein INT43_006070 [Umbelopsis isabellina]